MTQKGFMKHEKFKEVMDKIDNPLFYWKEIYL